MKFNIEFRKEALQDLLIAKERYVKSWTWK